MAATELQPLLAGSMSLSSGGGNLCRVACYTQRLPLSPGSPAASDLGYPAASVMALATIM